MSKVVRRLTNGKARGEDCILNGMIKAFSENHLHLLTQTFNVVLLSGHVPNEWATGVIKPIYKIKVTLMTRITTEGYFFSAA